MSRMTDDLRAAVVELFAAASPGREEKFPVGPVSAKTPGYDPQEIDALPATAVLVSLK